MSEAPDDQPQSRQVPLGPGQRRAPLAYWFVGPEASRELDDPATAQPDEQQSAAAIELEARDAADRDTLEELATVRSRIDRLRARSTELEARLARSAIERGGRSQQSQSIELRSMAREVAARLTISHGSARRSLEYALTMTSCFPTLLQAQADGLLHAGQVSVIERAGGILTDGDVSQERRDEYVAEAIAAAAGRVPTKLKIVVQRIAEAKASVPVTIRHERAIADRYVSVTDVDDGMAYLSAFLPSAQAHAIEDRLDQGADARCDDDPRTADQWRADALSAILITGDAVDEVHHCDEASCIPRMLAGITAHIAITVPMLSLAIDDPSYPVQPAMLDGATPMSLTTAAAFVGDRGAMRRWLTHPVTGQVIAVDARFATRQLEREVHGRDGTRCRGSTCASARKLQQDHNRQWSRGGPTSYDNLADLCPSCHIVKDSTRWQLHLSPLGHAHWTSPLGYSHTDAAIPPDIPLDRAHLPCTLPDA